MRAIVGATDTTLHLAHERSWNHGILKCIPMWLFIFEQILHSMSSVKWDIKEIKSQHSGYVDRLIQVF